MTQELSLSYSVRETWVSKTTGVKCNKHDKIPTGNVIAQARIFVGVKEIEDVKTNCFSKLLSRHFQKQVWSNIGVCLVQRWHARSLENFEFPDVQSLLFAQTHLCTFRLFSFLFTCFLNRTIKRTISFQHWCNFSFHRQPTHAGIPFDETIPRPWERLVRLCGEVQPCREVFATHTNAFASHLFNLFNVYTLGYAFQLAFWWEHQDWSFCECLENVINDCSLMPRQTNSLNILEPWKHIVSINHGELVTTAHAF